MYTHSLCELILWRPQVGILHFWFLIFPYITILFTNISRHFWVDDFPAFPFGGICDRFLEGKFDLTVASGFLIWKLPYFEEQVSKTALECEARPGWHLKFDVIDMKKQVLDPSFVVFFLAHGWVRSRWGGRKWRERIAALTSGFFRFWYLFFGAQHFVNTRNLL